MDWDRLLPLIMPNSLDDTGFLRGVEIIFIVMSASTLVGLNAQTIDRYAPARCRELSRCMTWPGRR